MINKRSNPFKRNPFDESTTTSNESTVLENVNNASVDKETEQIFAQQSTQPTPQYQQQQPVQQNYNNYQQPIYQPQYQYEPQPRYNQPRRPIENNKEKYTATMDRGLRTQIKIACATKGIMFSQFIEDACREKLSREGAKK